MIIAILSLSACGIKSDIALKPVQDPTGSPSATKDQTIKTTPEVNPFVGIKTKNGQIVVKLYADVAPKTVANFLTKSKSGFYNNLSFHRVIPGFMAQGGDPTGTGTGGGDQPSELNNLPFKRGSLGLARTPVSKNVSNDSQFFICFSTEGCQHLTGDYVNFGEVVTGFDVLDKIQANDLILTITQNTK